MVLVGEKELAKAVDFAPDKKVHERVVGSETSGASEEASFSTDGSAASLLMIFPRSWSGIVSGVKPESSLTDPADSSVLESDLSFFEESSGRFLENLFADLRVSRLMNSGEDLSSIAQKTSP